MWRGRKGKTTVRRGGPGYERGFVPTTRFTKLGKWFALGKNDIEYHPIDDSKVAAETNQNARTGSFVVTHESLNFSTTIFATT